MNAILVLGARAVYLAAIQGEVSWGLLLAAAAAGLCILAMGYFGNKVFGAPQNAPAPPPQD
ncbi:MAG: hypothetical protein C4519_06660 [Desulfobacteraceae bacterium]|nr:MAG: hypothetical protein C4519_06660 [Desulfobacteraceae bacterium]